MSEAPELTLSQINGRFKVLDGPVALPGKCAVCGGVKGKFVDFGLDLDFYGAVIFCVPCIVAAAEVVDLIPGSKYRELEDQYALAIANITEAESIINGYADRYNTLHDDFISSLRGTGTPNAQSDEASVSEPEQATPGNSEQISDSVIDEGSTSVSSSSSDGDGSIFDF